MWCLLFIFLEENVIYLFKNKTSMYIVIILKKFLEFEMQV